MNHDSSWPTVNVKLWSFGVACLWLTLFIPDHWQRRTQFPRRTFLQSSCVAQCLCPSFSEQHTTSWIDWWSGHAVNPSWVALVVGIAALFLQHVQACARCHKRRITDAFVPHAEKTRLKMTDWLTLLTYLTHLAVENSESNQPIAHDDSHAHVIHGSYDSYRFISVKS